jgi:hypothetical protein
MTFSTLSARLAAVALALAVTLVAFAPVVQLAARVMA